MSAWERSSSILTDVVWDQTEVCLKVYARDPSRVQQDANNERRISQGGYATRQLEELLQNGVDAARRGGARVEVLLTQEALYVANDGEPFDERGVRSVMASDISTKDDDKIGKFGIGFKSVLAVSEGPMIFSRSISFGFDKAWSEATLREAGYELPHYPAMRLARTLDPHSEGLARDAHLGELMGWASTVVKVPLLPFRYAELSRRLYDFPAEFVLFSPHIKQARLRNLAEPPPTSKSSDRAKLAERAVTQLVRADGTIELRSGGATTRWSISRSSHVPSAQALDEAGHVASREKVDLQFALPLPPSARLGRFWAYFPTNFETTLAGLVNAPWKLSDDRTGLLEGTFNSELLARLPRLFADSIQAMSGTDHAVTALDAMPARGLESRNWVDRDINEPIFIELRRSPSLPDGNSVLRVPSEVQWVGDVEDDWLARWASIDGAPKGDWVHPDSYRSPERRNKVERLMQASSRADAAYQGPASIDRWLEALVHDGKASSSEAAIHLAARLIRDVEAINDIARKRRVTAGVLAARIIRLEDGSFTAPKRGRVFVRAEGEQSPDVAYVDRGLTRNPDVVGDLKSLGVTVMDRSGELRRLIAKADGTTSDSGRHEVWSSLWRVTRELPTETAADILREDIDGILEHRIMIRTAAGAWRRLSGAYLAGRIIPADGSRDRVHLIDPTFHDLDQELLGKLGAVDAPKWRHAPPSEEWVVEWEEIATDQFVRHVKGAKIDPSKVVIEPATAPPWPLQPLTAMSDEARAAATAYLLTRDVPMPRTVRHFSNSSYGKIGVIAPETWFLRRHGRVKTTFGTLPPSRVLRSDDDHDPRVLPVYEASGATSAALALKESPDDLEETDWAFLKQVADAWRGPDTDRNRAEFYAWLPGRITPETLTVRVGSQLQQVAVGNIGVTLDASDYESMREAQIPGLLVGDAGDLERFVEAWEMPRAKDLLQEEVIADFAGEETYLTDAFPPLKLRLDLVDHDVRLQPVSRLVRMTATPRGQVARPIDARRDGDIILVTADDPQRRLGQISTVLGLGLDSLAIATILRDMERTATNQRRLQIRAAASDDERLVVAVGVEALRRTIPAQALRILEESGPVTPVEVAALARSVHGVGILRQLRPAFDEAGLQPPKEWAGRRVTRQWVNALGFPTEWAGFPGTGRAAVEMVDGPAELNPLHGYQVFVTDRIKSLLRGVGPDRGMLSLPTGAGKTRVTVEALVRGVSEGDIPVDAPLVWIAQTDELCEQAAETWTYVWRAMGPRHPVRLGRLWASNEVPEEPGAFQLVIATVDKLHALSNRADDEYEWLRQPSMVIIDEAHTSIAPQYTQVLEWLGRSSRRSAGVRSPLIGLTATPFRGTSEVETERLVARYGKHRLDRGAFFKEDPYEELQGSGVLAQVKHQVLDGTDVRLTESDIAEIEKMRRLPSAVSERLGSDATRTVRVVESIAALPDDWTVLAFAPSVENARVLAALLAHRGVPAVSISAETEASARRHYVGEFKAGRIRVLTNFNVLTQGFDAPRVQAVYVARPTFSPNVYQQMIGRGLRGPENGGSEEVLIVNVRDNFQKYGDLLAFNEFEYLWKK